MNSIDDTIVAPATPLGEGGIAVVRVSGNAAIDISEKCFSGKIKMRDAHSHTVHYGKFLAVDGRVLDDVLMTLFRSPNSYTGEDVVEISCHGSIFIVEQIIQEITKVGARIADPGEFTKRAFLNEKMDLSQAEAVADLINARTEMSHLASINILHGGLRKKIDGLKNELLDLCSNLEIGLDFSEEGIEIIDDQKIKQDLNKIINVIQDLRGTFRNSKALREGINVAIIGRPNVGKSSIFNYLVSDNRAIVTEIPGTTRDVIREGLTINGLLFILSDTAGIRNTADIVEIEGMKRSLETIKTADIVINVVDVFDYIEGGGIKPIDDLKSLISPDTKVIYIINKIDLNKNVNMAKRSSQNEIYVSAVTGEGMKDLENEIFNYGINRGLNIGDKNIVVINSRHLSCFNNANESLVRAKESIGGKIGNEFIAVDIREAIRALEEVTGTISSDEILDNIFSKFCIGK